VGGLELGSLSAREHRRHLGGGIGLILQDPVTSLSPVVPIGRQITDGMRFHSGRRGRAARALAVDLLDQVGISEPRRRFDQFPHELSGGMRQRVLIAAALACEPTVLIADEATTALDVTVQKQILDLLGKLQEQRRMSVIIISHDLAVVAGRTRTLAVMYAGQIVETGRTRDVFSSPRHRYTTALLESIPDLNATPHSKVATIPGAPPRPNAMPAGCRFAPRCGAATEKCHHHEPGTTSAESSHLYRCWWPAEAQAQTPEPIEHHPARSS
jgi:peptide/nickel transport system ATP-binding protein